MTTMLSGLKDNMNNVARTTNGARAFSTTNSYVLDFFAQAGAMRTRSEADIINAFVKAFNEDKLLAMKALFYIGDVRGGQGERRTRRVILKYLANTNPQSILMNAHLIAEYGRWDDLYSLFDTPLEGLAGDIICTQLTEDLVSEYPSLLAKWLKSENASSYETKRLARKTRELLDLSSRDYRKALSMLRKRINIIENLMRENKWDEIDYSKIPSKAGLVYRQAFYRNDAERYMNFVESATKGEVKVNTKTLYPYEIVAQIPNNMESLYNRKYNAVFGTAANEPAINMLWESLTDYIGDNGGNSISVMDTSGSMRGLPIQIAISLGLYMAERNKGAYQNHFITFSSEPKLVEITGDTFCERVRNISRANWDQSTNIEKVFDLILTTAIENRVPQAEMIERIFIVSDMQFNGAVNGGNDQALFRQIRDRFEKAGYQMPQLVFWQVNATTTQFPMTINDNGVQLVSGASPSIFTNLMKGKTMTAYEMMLDVLNADRYSAVMI